jgi:hypothetical protein
MNSDKWAVSVPKLSGSVAVGQARPGEGERKEVLAELRANMEEVNKLRWPAGVP